MEAFIKYEELKSLFETSSMFNDDDDDTTWGSGGIADSLDFNDD